MAFHDPLYDVFVLKETADSPAPWVWDNCQAFEDDTVAKGDRP
jgi:hypothetical protein